MANADMLATFLHSVLHHLPSALREQAHELLELPPVEPEREALVSAIRRVAGHLHGAEGVLEIDPNAPVLLTGSGAWIGAWVFLAIDEMPDPLAKLFRAVSDAAATAPRPPAARALADESDTRASRAHDNARQAELA